ncbi:copper chaperone PCu(A)C [Roseibium sp. M-1]
MRLCALLLTLLLTHAGPSLAAETHPSSGDGQDHSAHHDAQSEEGHDHGDHEGSAEGVHAVHAWIQATSGGTALVFVDIDNNSDQAVKLLGGHTDAARSVELVGFVLKDGEPGYDALPPVPIQPGKELLLTPNGLALRLNGLKRTFQQGEDFEIEIEFDFGHFDMQVQVEAADATRHSHAGHQH